MRRRLLVKLVYTLCICVRSCTTLHHLAPGIDLEYIPLGEWLTHRCLLLSHIFPNRSIYKPKTLERVLEDLLGRELNFQESIVV